MVIIKTTIKIIKTAASHPFHLSRQSRNRCESLNFQETKVNFQVRNRRQLILQFITANKGRLSDTYVCLICNKQVVKFEILLGIWNFFFPEFYVLKATIFLQVTDNSNMNKHLEFKHGSELKLFLQSLAL